MAITPGPGYMVDPSNPNSVIPVGSTAQAQGLGVYNTPPAASTPSLSVSSSTQASNPTNPAPASTAASQGLSTAPSNPTIGSTAATGDQLYNSLNDQFNDSPTAQTIMQNYAAQSANTNTNLANSNTATQNYYSGQSAEQQIQGAAALQSATTASKGLVNPSAMGIIQDQSLALLSTINNQMNDAIASNNSAAAEQLSNAAATETSNLVAARQNFLNSYFQTQTATQSEASFQTPVQQAVMSLATQYPQAGILPTDDMATAQQKITATPQYQQNIALGQANIKAALATANASNASASASSAAAGLTSTQQQQAQVELQALQQSGQYSSDVNSLLSGSATDATLQSKYGSYPGGMGGIIVANIENAAQAQGWSPQQSSLTSLAQKTNAEAANSGNPLTEGTATFSNFLSAAGTKIGNTLQSLSPSASGTTNNGLQYTVQ